MRTERSEKKRFQEPSLWIGALMILLFLAGSLSVKATDYSSANFKVQDASLGGLGGFGSSTSFGQSGALDVTGPGEASSSGFILRSGPLYADSFTPVSERWRWYSDYENETPGSPLGNENVAPSDVANQTILKLRVTVKETAGAGAVNQKFKLQFSEYPDFSTGVKDVVETGSCIATSSWCYADGGGNDNALVDQKLLSDADPCSSGAGAGCGTHNESGISSSTSSQLKNSAAEYEFTVKNSGAKPTMVYFFRLFDMISGAPVPLGSSETYPSLQAKGPTLDFRIEGLPAGTSTADLVMSVSTTPNSVDFGNLPFGTPTNAAHRLVISTNAGAGYKIFVFSDQQLLGASGAEIPPVSASNESPAGWNTGCAADSSGCFGYHTTDATLDGNSIRFAAPDSFARFETTTKEVAFAPGPAASDTVDMIYRTVVRSAQAPGDYSDSVNYIIVPVF